MNLNKKNSFILYDTQYDGISLLSLEERGRLLTAIFEYRLYGKSSIDLSEQTAMAFHIIKGQIARDAKKYNDVCERRRAAGAQGGFAKASKTTKNETNVANDSKCSKSQQMPANEADVSKCQQMKQMLANVADNDNEYDNEYEYEYEYDNKNNYSYNNTHSNSVCVPPACAKENTHPTEKEVREYFSEKGYTFFDKFYAYYESINWNNAQNWRARADLWHFDNVDKEQAKKENEPRSNGNIDAQDAMKKALERSEKMKRRIADGYN